MQVKHKQEQILLVYAIIELIKPQSRTKRMGQQASSPLPPLTMLIIGWFFLFLLEETRYFPTLIRGDGGYVIWLKCPNCFWPGLLLIYYDEMNQEYKTDYFKGLFWNWPKRIKLISLIKELIKLIYRVAVLSGMLNLHKRCCGTYFTFLEFQCSLDECGGLLFQPDSELKKLK